MERPGGIPAPRPHSHRISHPVRPEVGNPADLLRFPIRSGQKWGIGRFLLIPQGCACWVGPADFQGISRFPQGSRAFSPDFSSGQARSGESSRFVKVPGHISLIPAKGSLCSGAPGTSGPARTGELWWMHAWGVVGGACPQKTASYPPDHIRAAHHTPLGGG